MTAPDREPADASAPGQPQHSTSSGPARARPGLADRRRRTDREIALFGLGLFAIAVLLVFLPDLAPAASKGMISERIHARIVSLAPASELETPTAIVEYLEGPERGEHDLAGVVGPSSQLRAPDYRAGDEVIVSVDQQPDGTVSLAVVDRWRLPLVGSLALAFALAMIALAGWRGLRAVVSLLLTLTLVVRVLVPLLLAGWNPLVLAIGLGVLITLLSTVMTQGFSRTTIAAIAGTSIGLLVTGALGALVTGLAQFTPAQGSEQVVSIAQLAGPTIDLSGLLLAAVIFGGLGVLIDAAIGQATAVGELHRADLNLRARILYERAMNIGIAHLAATVNTLVFAYLGTALPLLILFSIQARGLGFPLNEEVVAVEVVRTLVGSLGIVAVIPITTGIAVWSLTWPSAEGRRAQKAGADAAFVAPDESAGA